MSLGRLLAEHDIALISLGAACALGGLFFFSLVIFGTMRGKS